MSKKKDIWNQITRNLESKIPDPDFKTWFSRTTLQKLEPGQAVIGVPNKYVSNWLQEKYLPEITKSFKTILKQEPDIYFSHQKPPVKKRSQSAPPIEKRDPTFKHFLDPSMTFRRFIMGKGNRFARTSSIEVAKRSNNDYNPLYIYCHMGLGKTLQALAIILERAEKGPTLVVAPTSVCMNWMSEANRFAPTLNLMALNSKGRKNRRMV